MCNADGPQAQNDSLLNGQCADGVAEPTRPRPSDNPVTPAAAGRRHDEHRFRTPHSQRLEIFGLIDADGAGREEGRRGAPSVSMLTGMLITAVDFK